MANHVDEKIDVALTKARAQADNVIELIGPDCYERLAPNLFNFASSDDEMRSYMLQTFGQSHVDTPPEDIYVLRDAFVAALPLVFTREKAVFGPSAVDHHTIHSHEFFVELCDGNIPYLDAAAIFIFKAGTENYGHILVEMLPKLENIAHVVTERTAILVPPLPGSMIQQLTELVEILYPGKFFVEVMRHPMVQVRELFYPGPVSKHNVRKSRTLLRFSDRILNCVKPGKERRLYVSREQIDKRRMINERGVRASFEAAGYVAVHPERLTLLEQASLFAPATHIAGPLGAALTNSIFASEGANVFMVDPSLCDFFFWDLAGLRRQRFSWYFSAPVTRFSIDRLHQDYSVAIDSLESAIKLSAAF